MVWVCLTVQTKSSTMIGDRTFSTLANYTIGGSCLKTGQHLISVIIYLLLPIKYIFFDPVS